MIIGRWLLLAVACCLTSGCAAVVAGGIFYDHAKSREDRAAFTADYRKQNLEREEAGLQPLDWCTELYRTKQSWYAEDATCTPAKNPSPANPAPVAPS